MYRSTISAPRDLPLAQPPLADPYRLACEVADVLAGMTYAERIRAYRSRIFTPCELAIAAARLPDEMPKLNGDYEWLVFDLE